MKNKTCGDCKHFYTSDEGQCSLKDDWGFTDSDACPDFKSKIATNGDKVRSMCNDELAELDICEQVRKKHGRIKCLTDMPHKSCRICKLDWLNAPAESEGEDE